jgi:molybdate transport system substrate-binding protein
VRRAFAVRAGLALFALPLAAGCGESSSADSGSKSPVVVSAASSMTEALKSCSPDARLQFAGSDELAAQIERGVKPDVYAAANTKLPDELNRKGLLSTPVEFATNTFVLAVPKDSDIRSVGDLTASGVKIAIGAEEVPIGAYTRDSLAKLPPGQEKAILANVKSNEPDVKGIVGKLTQGAADAGFVYITDVNATNGQLKAIKLPAAVEPEVTYEAGVVKGAKHPKQAQTYVDQLVMGGCAQALQQAGFGAAN